MFTKRNASLAKEIQQLQSAEADLLASREKENKRNKPPFKSPPQRKRILDNYDTLTTAEKNRLWEQVLKKATIYRSPDDEVVIRIYPNLPK